MEIDAAPPSRLIAWVAALSEAEVQRRRREDNDVFLLRVNGEPAAYGWSARGPAEIGGLDLRFTVPSGERYLWDFATLPTYRGRGLYPLLLQAILRRQMAEAEWFWIGHEPHNEASRRGILKAGFRLAGHVQRRPDGQLVLSRAAEAEPALARGAARLLGLPLLDGAPSQEPSASAGCPER